jgi:hypothetical protein
MGEEAPSITRAARSGSLNLVRAHRAARPPVRPPVRTPQAAGTERGRGRRSGGVAGRGAASRQAGTAHPQPDSIAVPVRDAAGPRDAHPAWVRGSVGRKLPMGAVQVGAVLAAASRRAPEGEEAVKRRIPPPSQTPSSAAFLKVDRSAGSSDGVAHVVTWKGRAMLPPLFARPPVDTTEERRIRRDSVGYQQPEPGARTPSVRPSSSTVAWSVRFRRARGRGQQRHRPFAFVVGDLESPGHHRLLPHHRRPTQRHSLIREDALAIWPPRRRAPVSWHRGGGCSG